MPPAKTELIALLFSLVVVLSEGCVSFAQAAANVPTAGRDDAERAQRSNYLQGARQFWSFSPRKDPAVPQVTNRRWPRNSIDHFILAKLEEQRITPNSPAAKRTLLRRASFDLTGLPPPPEEIEAFVHDSSPASFAAVIDRLLASPHYGERWGRHWLDLARYADTAGDSADYPVPQAYLYRDYVIAAFNQDKPYDQFLREQIAGDLLPGPAAGKEERLIATGFLALARRFGVEPDNAPHLTLEDTLDTLGRSVLGLSLSCARCHDHKYDPIPTSDYYALYGIFQSTRFPYPGSEEKKRPRDFIPLMSHGETDALLKPYQEKLYLLQSEVKGLEQEEGLLTQILEQAAAAGDGKLPVAERIRFKEVRRALAEAREQRDDYAAHPPPTRTAYAVAEGKPANARIQKRGEPGSEGEEVPRHFLQILGGQPLPKNAPGSGRLELAGWLSDPANPLTARVMVNRIWQHHFGQGLVQTPSDFGTRGRAPSHPELLDFLASRFIEGGWSIKAMHRLIMLSQTYQQASRDQPQGLRKDPNNEWLWKYSRTRLDAESIRDAMLAISGELDSTAPGPHPFPPPSTWDFTQHTPFNAVYEKSGRSVYLMQQRIKKHPFLAMFDGADPNVSTGERPASLTPLQALFMINDPFVHQQSIKLAERLVRSRSGEADRIRLAYELVFSRSARGAEIRAGQLYLKQFRKKLGSLGVPADQRLPMAWSSFARALLGSNEFIYVD